MKRYLFSVVLALMFIGNGYAQSVTVDASIDSLQILIGEQTRIKLEVSLDANKRAIFPIYRDTLVHGVEIIDIAKESSIQTIVEVISLPSVGYSRRKLIHNYYKDLNEKGTSMLSILEKITKKRYLVKEEKDGTGFILDEILNGTSVISSLYHARVDYILLREEKIDSFLELIHDTKQYIKKGCNDSSYVEKYKKLGHNTGFFFKKTIYRVKK